MAHEFINWSKIKDSSLDEETNNAHSRLKTFQFEAVVEKSCMIIMKQKDIINISI